MFTKRSLPLTLVLLFVLGLTLSACATPSVDVLVEEQMEAEGAPAAVQEVEVPEEAPAAVAEEPEAAPAEADLDTAYGTFLSEMEGYGVITVEGLNEALAEEPPFLVDVRQPEEVEENGYIEGAINIPLRELAQHTDLLPSFDTLIVVYCGSGWRSTIAMTALEGLGWSDVQSMKGGLGAWLEAGYPVVEGAAPEAEVLAVAEPDPALLAATDANLSSIPEGWGVVTAEALAEELADNPDLILIDVRRQDEVDQNGQIENAIHIPIEEFVAGQADWPADKDASIVVYCGSGHRSTIGMTILRSYGYTDVRSLKGGFGAWTDAGNPVVTAALALVFG